MTTGEVLNRIKGLSKDTLYYWEASGFLEPRKYQRGRVEKRDYTQKDFQIAQVMYKYYEKGFPPKRCFEKAQQEIKGTLS
jgi:DNA-binding transcriptional MerR regulator